MGNPYTDDDLLCESKVGNAHDTHAVAISIDNNYIIYANRWREVVAHLLTAQLQDQTFALVLFKNLAKKLGKLTSIHQIRQGFLPPKFFTIR